MAPETRYARSGDVAIAYQVVGDGPFDLIWVPGAISNVELTWEDPPRVLLPAARGLLPPDPLRQARYGALRPRQRNREPGDPYGRRSRGSRRCRVATRRRGRRVRGWS